MRFNRRDNATGRGRRSTHNEDEATTENNDRTIGLLWLAGGAAFTLFTYAAAGPGGTYVVTWGAMLYGAVKFFGSFANVTGEDGEALPYRDRIVLGQEMALRAMYYVAREAGGVNAARAVTINKVLWRITDSQFPADRQAVLFEESEISGDGVLTMLRAERTRIAASFTNIVLEAAAEVVRSEDTANVKAEAALQAIGHALGLDDAAVKAALAADR